MTIQQQCFYVFSLLSSWYFGYLVGRLIEKRKRDKQMAHLVAERLLGSKRGSSDMSNITQSPLAMMGQQATFPLQNSNNSPIRRAVVSQYPEVRNAIGEHHAQEVLKKALIRDSNGSSVGQSKVS